MMINTKRATLLKSNNTNQLFTASTTNASSSSVSVFTNYECLNSRMQQIAPILASQYTRYPIEYEEWLLPFSQTPDNKPTFMPQSTPPSSPPHEGDPRFLDYCWGNGHRGLGYYHLLTKDAYAILIQDLEDKISTLSTCLTSFSCLQRTVFANSTNIREKSLHSHMEVIELLKHRLASDTPNDFNISKKLHNDVCNSSQGNPLNMNVTFNKSAIVAVKKSISERSSEEDGASKRKRRNVWKMR